MRDLGCDCMMCRMMEEGVSPEEALRMSSAKIIQDVALLGWSGIAVIESEETRSFAYTVGLSGKGTPDLVVVGLPPETAHALIHEILALDQPLEAGREYPGLGGEILVRIVEPLPGVAQEMTSSRSFHESFVSGSEWHPLQLLWPDIAGHFPGESGYDMSYGQTIKKETLQ